MVSLDAGHAASARLRRVRWLLHAHNVENKLHALRTVVKAKFDPNQPRVAAGNPDGGQWTDGGAGGRLGGSAGSDTLTGGRSRRSGFGSIYINGQRFELTPGQSARYTALSARYDSLEILSPIINCQMREIHKDAPSGSTPNV